MQIAWFDDEANSTGALASRLASDAPLVSGAVSDLMGLVVQNLAVIGGGFGLAFYSSWKVALVVIALLPLEALGLKIQTSYNTGGAPALGWPGPHA